MDANWFVVQQKKTWEPILLVSTDAGTVVVVGCSGHHNWMDFHCSDHCSIAVQGKVDQGEKGTGKKWIANCSTGNCSIGNCWMKEVASTVAEALCYSSQPAADHSRTR